MTEGRACGNRGEQNARVLHLAENFGAEKIALRAGFHEFFEGDWISGSCECKVFAQHRADLIFLARDAVLNQITDYRPKEKPPQIECAIEAMQAEGFDGEPAVAQ